MIIYLRDIQLYLEYIERLGILLLSAIFLLKSTKYMCQLGYTGRKIMSQ
jgi:hypothetical protein